ncbi:MAG: hypothetical protein ACHQXA_07545, partial [Gemmatimonadales bacterium]
MSSRIALTLILSAALAAPAVAQGPCGANGPHLPAVGAWASFNTVTPGRDGPRSSTMKMAYLNHESSGERLEFQITSERGAVVMQMLVDGFPYDASSMKEVVFKMGDRPAMKVGDQMMQMMRSRAPNSGITKEMCAELTKVGEETVTVPAGSFKTTHYHSASKNTDVWVSSSSPFGLIKEKGADTSMELTGTGTGAKTAIT